MTEIFTRKSGVGVGGEILILRVLYAKAQEIRRISHWGKSTGNLNLFSSGPCGFCVCVCVSLSLSISLSLSLCSFGFAAIDTPKLKRDECLSYPREVEGC